MKSFFTIITCPPLRRLGGSQAFYRLQGRVPPTCVRNVTPPPTLTSICFTA
ncbi:hypothetical protein E2C01_080598 [Portunus trituberculatus]|uniref:Uncharacterized protein n=1 Tax=Portunus trituberculatus TaxID=210409 RepID=A0A5B7IPM4_PORTR|nr:hypothetical protein [Portunus trituberculatus]